MHKKRLIAVHLLNDRSGSPLVFKQALEILQPHFDIELYTANTVSGGFLDELGVKKHPLNYQWHPNKIITLAAFFKVQFFLFFKLFFSLKKTDTVYINTLLPAGALIAAKLKGCRLYVHVHEVSIKPRLLKKALTFIVSKTADKIFFVSHYVASQFRFKKASCKVIYNALSAGFTNKADAQPAINLSFPFTVLMLCSLKAYKGIYEFIQTAKTLPKLKFILVLNASADEVQKFCDEVGVPKNCVVHPCQKETIPFYNLAHVVVNFSRPTQWVETFGMTVLEAMYCGRPVVIPPVGGICELVEDGKEGYRVNPADQKAITDSLQNLCSDVKHYIKMSEAAKQRAACFTYSTFRGEILNAFNLSQPEVEVYKIEENSTAWKYSKEENGESLAVQALERLA